MALYADVILPKPLDGTFSYVVPQELESRVAKGMRVVVPFGSKRRYTAVVDSTSALRPTGAVNLKEICQVLDDAPIVRHPQLKFWHWVADYYLSPIGDVMKAALPSGLKLESETVVCLSPDAPMDRADELTETELTIIQFLDKKGRASTDEIERNLGRRDCSVQLSGLLSRGFIEVSERMVERYRAVKTTYVEVALPRGDSQAMSDAFGRLSRSVNQQQAFLALVEASGFNRSDGEPTAVPRARLVEQTGLPASVFQQLEKKGLVRLTVRQESRFSFTGKAEGVLPTLSEAQGEALRQIHDSFHTHAVSLLHGVTSSGKTELYIHLIDYVLRRGDQALFLVPEIALTTQLTRRLQRVFGPKVVIYHSKFSDNERVDIWRRMLETSDPVVVIGARSAVFLPFAKLGLVIVDEEHESSYKQFDPAPRYNARDAAIVLAGMHGAKTLLGSATPSIETYYKASTGKYGLISLTERFGGVQLPHIEVVDMSKQHLQHAVSGALSHTVIRTVRHALDDGKQSIFFLNRRGYSPIGRCKLCRFVLKCDHCDVSLTYHRHPESMVCHYCGAIYPVPKVCPACHEPSIEIAGYGTERIEDEISHRFEGARLLRMDLDTTRNKDAYSRIIDDFSQHKADILVGTQMVTKGLDFSDVNTVAILSADALINYPDFRASERAFNMLEQVAGRSGRRSGRGQVLIQTFSPEHPVIKYVTSHNYQGFYSHELAEREKFNYPPFTRIINIYIKHRERATAERMADEYARRLRYLLGNRVSDPIEPPVARIQSLYIRRIMLKLELNASLTKVKELLRQLYIDTLASPDMRGLQIYYDVDPA